uniref:receptor protein-tyrosine kinase n=1 Tax=Schmidtea mediterranea TaxID=79327 RepID=A0A1B1ACY9_SCHMD|nr:epidermal growth factor receptor Smed-egfr-5 [Schmidtea mediterranea]
MVFSCCHLSFKPMRSMLSGLSTVILLSFLILAVESMYNNQDIMFKFFDFQSYLKNKERTENHQDMELYFEAIKETFELYNQDKRYRHGKVCKSTQTQIDVSKNSYESLKRNFDKNCSYIIGDVVIAHITNENISFLNSIEDISGYLMIFSNAVESISLIKLKVIRGENPLLIKGLKFSLIVGYNSMLENILFPNLQVILRHNVFFNNNPKLCYASRKINWNSLMRRSQEVVIVETNEKDCGLNSKIDEELSCHESCQAHLNKTYCWGNSSSACQKINDCANRTCYDSTKCYINEILKSEECCHEECVGGCTGPARSQCLACKNFNNNGICVENCPPEFKHDGMKYIQNPLGKLAFYYICVDKCPKKFFNEHGNCVTQCSAEKTYAVNQTCVPCPNGKCPKICRARDILDSQEISYVHRKVLGRLENCTVYDGNILINRFSLEGDNFHNLSKQNDGIRKQDLKKLENLEEIYGYLRIHVPFNSNWTDSLEFLKNLRIIRAENVRSHKSRGIEIVGNPALKYLGLRNLKEVRNGNIIIFSNNQLCFSNTLTNKSILHKGRFLRALNGKIENCSKKKCHSECEQRLGCWGPEKYHCVKCKSFVIRESKTCLSKCSNEPGYFYNSSSDHEVNRSCSRCHSECLPGINTCHGSNENECNLGCKNYKFGESCIKKCPAKYYVDSMKNCYPCHTNCTENSQNKESTCHGPEDSLGQKGCSICNHIIVSSNHSTSYKNSSNFNILKCLKNSDICPKGFYKSIIDFRSGMKVNAAMQSTMKILEKWIEIGTNHDLPIASVCLPCHPYCSECHGGSSWHCSLCKYFRSDNKCIQKCPKEYFITVTETAKPESECKKCHEECSEGCLGSTNYDCLRCKHAKIYVNGSTQFFCNSTCGDRIQLFQTSEIICTDHLIYSRFNMYIYIGGPAGIVISFVFIIVCFILSSKNQEKKFKTKLVNQGDFYPSDTGTNSGVLPNMATLLLITESQLTRQEIIGSGAFGIVYKGIWQPNIDAIDKSNSFLKRNISKISQDSSIKLNVAVKILTDISDPSNNREILEEAKVMASVDHPCCLRILAVCLTAHPKLITQFMPLGSLLEFVQRNRSLINSITLLIWAKQIASGMEYLESKGIIHCDLAARNVLIQSPRQVKITDFGLAKMLDYSQQQYQFKGGRMPIKWLAVECIRNRIFSSKSDVWSYGVTLWEMFSYGEKPFADIKAYDILEHLEKGQRLNQPKICSIDAYTILVQCWLVDPDARPSFTELRKTFEMMSSNPNRYLLVQDEDSNEPLYVEWEEDAQKYDEFLQALVTVSHINSSYESAATKPIDRKHIKSVRDRYHEMRAYKNCFINNENYCETDGKKHNTNSTNPDYTALLLQGKNNSNQTGSTWSDYFDSKKKRTSNCTTLTNLNLQREDCLKKEILETDLSEDGYLIPISAYRKESAIGNPIEKFVYVCEKPAEKEMLINHESSI